MRSFLRMLEDVFAAAAFAEQGDRETAMMIAGTKPRPAKRTSAPPRAPRPRAA